MFFRWFWFGLRASVYPLFQMQVWNTCHMRRVHTGYLRWTPALAPLSQIWELPSVVSWAFRKKAFKADWKQENFADLADLATQLWHTWPGRWPRQKLPIFHRICSPSTLPLRFPTRASCPVDPTEVVQVEWSQTLEPETSRNVPAE